MSVGESNASSSHLQPRGPRLPEREVVDGVRGRHRQDQDTKDSEQAGVEVVLGN